MSRKNYIAMAWVILCVGVLAISLFRCNLPENRDNPIVLAWVMLVLSFPSSILVALLLSLLPEHVLPSSAYGSLAVMWAMFFVPGYFQWFRLLPFLAGKLRNRKNRPEQAEPSARK